MMLMLLLSLRSFGSRATLSVGEQRATWIDRVGWWVWLVVSGRRAATRWLPSADLDNLEIEIEIAVHCLPPRSRARARCVSAFVTVCVCVCVGGVVV